MKIINTEFIEILKERGEDYINTFKEYDDKVKNQDLFYSLDTEDIMIEGINFSNSEMPNNFEEFDKDISYITISYYIKEYSRCSGNEEWENYKITFPGWILANEKEYNKKKEAKLDYFKKSKKDLNNRQRNSDLIKLKELSRKLGYKIEKEIK